LKRPLDPMFTTILLSLASPTHFGEALGDTLRVVCLVEEDELLGVKFCRIYSLHFLLIVLFHLDIMT